MPANSRWDLIRRLRVKKRRGIHRKNVLAGKWLEPVGRRVTE